MDGYNSKSYGNYLRKVRIKAGKTLGDIARALRVTVPCVSNVEMGKRGPFDDEQNKIISELLNISIEDLNVLSLRTLESMVAEHINSEKYPTNEDKKKQRLEFLECILTSLLGNSWREFTIQDAETFRLKQEGEELRILTRLSEIANKAFGGKSRIELNIFGDGTMECQQIHVEEVDDKYGWQKVKIRNAIPSGNIYKLTDGRMNELLNDLETQPWVDCATQTSNGAQYQIWELGTILKNITNIVNEYVDKHTDKIVSDGPTEKLIENITVELSKLGENDEKGISDGRKKRQTEK